jgi:hypothetical protein
VGNKETSRFIILQPDRAASELFVLSYWPALCLQFEVVISYGSACNIGQPSARVEAVVNSHDAEHGQGNVDGDYNNTQSKHHEFFSSVKGAGKQASEIKPDEKPGDHDLHPLLLLNGSEAILVLLCDEVCVFGFW